MSVEDSAGRTSATIVDLVSAPTMDDVWRIIADTPETDAKLIVLALVARERAALRERTTGQPPAHRARADLN